eukprot:5412326-Pyramimonas_sp.AAC.1
MVNTDGQTGMCADDDAFLNLPTTSASRPRAYDEYTTAWIFENLSNGRTPHDNPFSLRFPLPSTP